MIIAFKLRKAAALILPALFVLTFCISCAVKPSNITTDTPAPEATAEITPEITPEITAVPIRYAALEAYREIVAKAGKYDFGAGTDMPITGCRYALVQMQSGDDAPTLLLAQATKLGVEYVRIFRYDAETGNVNAPVLSDQDGMLMQGASSSGGFRGELSVFEDGIGICAYEFYSGTGDGTIRRIFADGDKLVSLQLWSGNVSDTVPFSLRAIENWFDAADGSGLSE